MEEYIKEIHIVFENCDVVRIPHEALYDVQMRISNMYTVNECQEEHADRVSLSIDTSRVKVDDSALEDWTTRKDITHLHFYYTSGIDRYIEVAYPAYFCCWRPNPYQNNYLWERETFHGKVTMLDIDIEPYWSILSVCRGINDWVRYFLSNKLNGARVLFGGYWATFKRHFKWRD